MEAYRLTKKGKKPPTDEELQKRRARYLAKRELIAANYKANRELILTRQKENKMVRRLEEMKGKLLEVKKTTNNLEVKQFINLIVGNPALFNIDKHVFNFIETVAKDFPYNNGSSFAVLESYDTLRIDALNASPSESESEPELNILIL